MGKTILLTAGDTYLHYRSIILIFILISFLLQNQLTFHKHADGWIYIHISKHISTDKKHMN